MTDVTANGPMVEFRKDLFADERDDNLNEIVNRRDAGHSRPRYRPLAILRRPFVRWPLAHAVRPLATPSCPYPPD